MRALATLSLLLLAACGEKDNGQPDAVTNILDQALPNAQQPPPPDNAITPAAPPPTLPVPQAGADAATLQIPAAVQGRWTGLRDACADKAAALELTVTPTSLVFHESVGKATAVRILANGRIAIDAAFTGEGQSWRRTVTLDAPAPDTLIVTNDGTSATRKRCPA